MDELKSLTLIVGFKTPKDILFRQELINWKQRMKVILTVDSNDEGSTYPVGLVTKYIPGLISLPLSNTSAIAVGPPAMMRFSTIGLLEIGLLEENIWISHERKMCCGIGKCGHCKIDDTYVCLDGPVFLYSKGKNLID